MSFLLRGEDLSFEFPNGTILFSNLNFSFGSIRTGLVGRNGTGKSTLLSILAGLQNPTRGHVDRSGRLAFLQQDTHVQFFSSVSHALSIADSIAAYERIHEGNGTPDDFELMEDRWNLYSRIEKALAIVGLSGLDWHHPYQELSGGETMRLRFARLLIDHPDFVLLDEPTNHLDRAGRKFVLDWIETWKGGLIVVSHDRELLDRMDQITVLDARGLHFYGGNYSFYKEQFEIERTAAEQVLLQKERAYRLAREQAQRARERQESRQAAGKRSGKRTGVSKLFTGNLQRKAEGSTARLLHQHEEKVEASRTAARQAEEAIVQKDQISIDLSYTSVPGRKRMLRLEKINVRYPAQQEYVFPRMLSFDITGPERIALKGRNGSGKSTLLHVIDGSLLPSTGQRIVGARCVTLLDQHVRMLKSEATLLENARRMAPDRPEQEPRLLLARFLFDKHTVDKIPAVVSGGERIRAGLACLLCANQAPDLLLLDEPTNNLDLSSIEELTSVLNAYRGALMVISHDEVFLREIGISRTIDLDAPVESAADSSS